MQRVSPFTARTPYLQETQVSWGMASGLPADEVEGVRVLPSGEILAITMAGASRFDGFRWNPVAAPATNPDFPPVPGAGEIRDKVTLPDGCLVVAAENGLFQNDSKGDWRELRPADHTRSWWPRDVRALCVAGDGTLWCALPQALAARHPDGQWTLFEGKDGLPCGDLTCIASDSAGKIWLGSHFGLARFDGENWAYRQGRRWLPDDDVRQIAVDGDGAAWIATAKGVGCIRFQPMTLEEKAEFYETQIDRLHRRTPFGYVLEVYLEGPGDLGTVRRHDSDNDGLWTGMYGAGECFAYAATRSPVAKRRARQAWEALRFLGTVTQGGEHPAPPGFVARTIRPAADGDPNAGEYTPEKDRQKQQRDRAWKVMNPRWPRSADGDWFWKADTSSDELDGHFFFYALYHDLVAETETEKRDVRAHACAIVDHLIDYGFNLVDHDGTPTRWSIFSPEKLNGDPRWFPERGLNSLSILSYLAVAAHLSGEARYRDVADELVGKHHYLQNLMVPKIHNGPGSGNQSDDEMAFMAFYHLILLTHDENVRSHAAVALHRYWRLERPERNPLFNFIHAVCCRGMRVQTFFADAEIEIPVESIPEAVDTLCRFPLDRCNWSHDNSRRLDRVPLSATSSLLGDDAAGRGHRVDGFVFPVDECHFNHWNYDPWREKSGGAGDSLADGAVFTLPYYLGRYHRLIPDA